MKATAEDEGEEGRERGYTGEEEERHAASSGGKKTHHRDTGRGLQTITMRRMS